MKEVKTVIFEKEDIITRFQKEEQLDLRGRSIVSYLKSSLDMFYFKSDIVLYMSEQGDLYMLKNRYRTPNLKPDFIKV